MDVEALYQEVIMDHYRNPRGRGLRDPYQAEVMHVNPTCGDEITLRVQVDGDELTDVSYWNQGCSISQASASVMFEDLAGGNTEHAVELLDEFVQLMHSKGVGEPDEEVLGDLVAFSGVAKYPARVKCALLPWMALREALENSNAIPKETS